MLIFTPSKNVSGRLISCHDDRYILNLATVNQKTIIVSNDNFRDLVAENPEYRQAVEERQLMYVFVGDNFMPPDDPLGKNGPKLDQFLRLPDPPISNNQPCPYSLKCTYGKKCKYFHPGRMQTTIADHLRDKQKLSGQNSLPLVRSKKALQPQNSLPINLTTAKAPTAPKSKVNLCPTQSIAYPLLASNAAFDASVQRFLQASAPLTKNLHPKLERQLTLNPFSNIIQVPSFSLVNLPSSSHSHSHLPTTSTNRTSYGLQPKQKLSHTKSNPVPSADLISPFIYSSAASKSSQNLDK